MLLADMALSTRENLIKVCCKELLTCVEYVNRYSDNKDHHFEIIKKLAKEYSEIEIENLRTKAAREATEKHLDDLESECIGDVKQIYNKYLEEQPSSSFVNHSIWMKIQKAVDGQTDSKDNSSIQSDGEENDESVQEGIIPTQFEPPIDPITKKIIENPYKNKICGHVYEYDAIMNYLKIKQNYSKRCPYIGCTNVKMNSSLIVKDNVLKQRIATYLRTTNQNDSEPSYNDSMDIL